MASYEMAEGNVFDGSVESTRLSRAAQASHAAASASILDLRRLLAERFPQTAPSLAGRFATGIEAIDQTLGGGLPKSAVTEVVSPNMSGGSALFISALVHAAYCGGYFIALVDGQDSFDPQPLGSVLLRNLLWARCHNANEAVKSTDLLLRDGNFPLVILDLVLNPAEQLRKIPQTTWYRLQRLVEPTSAAFVVLTRRSIISSAQIKVILENAWSLEQLNSAGDELLSRLRFRLERGHVEGLPELQIAS